MRLSKKVVRLIKKHATNDTIGQAMERSRETARKLVGTLKDEQPQIFSSKDCWKSSSEAAELIGLSAYTIVRLCKKGEIPHRRARGVYFIKKGVLDEFKQTLEKRYCKKCVICHAKMIVTEHTLNKKLCSEPCRKKQDKRLREKSIVTPPSAESLIGWYKHVYQYLQKHPVESQETVTKKEGCRMTGLSEMNIVWLAMRKVIQTKDHPTKTVRNKPVRTYLLAELKVAKKIYEKCHRNHSPKSVAS